MQPPEPQLAIEALLAIMLPLNHTHVLRYERGTEVHSSCSSSPVYPSSGNSGDLFVQSLGDPYAIFVDNGGNNPHLVKNHRMIHI